MFEDLGKPVTWVGSGADCEVRVSGSNVQPRHARIVFDNGKLFFENGTGQASCGGQSLPPNGRAEFDFSSDFKVGDVAVPLAHPAIVQMLMVRGELPLQQGTLTFGRDPSRSHVVIRHPNVSGRHATLTSNPLAVTDHGSTSGTWKRPSLPACIAKPGNAANRTRKRKRSRLPGKRSGRSSRSRFIRS